MSLAHELLRFGHVILFALWLGTGIGVYVLTRQTARPALPSDERRRLLTLLRTLDFFPRASLVLTIPTGVQLAENLQMIDIGSGFSTAIWVLSLGWLGLAIYLHWIGDAAILQRLDVVIHGLVMLEFLGFGAVSLVTGWPVDASWLSAKFVLFGLVLGIVIMLRGAMSVIILGFSRLEEAPDPANMLIADGRRQASLWIHVLWLAIIALGFLGVVQPFE